MRPTYLEDNPLWYKDAIIYELPVKAFYDSNDDGIGDFRGLTKKLDYLEGLGITAIWILPFYPSPLRDDGYDIADYFNVHRDYGGLRDFREFLKAAHQRGIRVIIELVLNHTSNEHEWFKRSRRAKPGSRAREVYVWSDSPDKYREARIIFSDFETSNWAWDPVAQAYYWHRFYSHQPDLNYDSPYVQKAMLRVIDFWFNLGVDGMRLDAVPYLYKREGTNCENLPETHSFLKKLRAHVDSKFKNRMLLAEANQWPEDAIAYFGAGDECHMAFHFPIMPRMFMAIQMEDSFPLIDILNVTPPIPESCQWATFLRNHDELTLEMVTDEERDYMYRVYAADPRVKLNLGIRRRLSPLLGNNRRKIELMNILLFSLPGTPVIYYGDEIGMGDNYYLGDRDGVRTPVQWSPDRNAGFSKANPQRLYLPVIIEPEYHYEAVNIENQEKNLSSPLWWMKRIIAMRKRYKAFSRGTLEILPSNNPKVLAFAREYQDETILIIANLSRFSQMVEFDLSRYHGLTLREVFSQNKFPPVRKRPYVITLGPYNHYWLLLQKERGTISVSKEKAIPEMTIRGNWEGVLEGRQKEKFEEQVLLKYLKGRRWFGAKAKIIHRIKILEDARIPKGDSTITHLLLVEVSYTEGSPDLYFLPLSFIPKNQAQRILEEFPQGVIADLRVGDEQGFLCDSIYDEEFRKILLLTVAHRRKIKGKLGEFLAFPGKRFKTLLSEQGFPLTSQPLKVEQSNTSVNFENRVFLKLYRRLDEGINPEVEIMKLLTERANFPNAPPFLGAVEYRYEREKTKPVTIALLQGFVDNEGDAWSYTKDKVVRYFERALAKRDEIEQIQMEYPPLLDTDPSNVPTLMQDLISAMYLEMASLLGKRTAELHHALGSVLGEEGFPPQPFTAHYQRALYQSMQSLVHRTLQSLQKNLKRIPENIRREAELILAAEQRILSCMQKILRKKISAMKIRIHGDYHLGQVLYTGKDFVIMDFEGEPARPLSERRLEHSPFKDVAGMIRSFHYAAYGALLLNSSFRPEDIPLLESWIEPWYHYVSGIFLHSYLNTLGDTPLVPRERDGLEILIQTFILEKAVYELGYELSHRPDWIVIPLKGIEKIMRDFS
jgi:maltose alpha-D-glucosyltransferase/alpha-amylase